MIKNDFKETVGNLLLKIPGGRISLRDNRTGQEWAETIDAFYMSKYLVTQDLYKMVVNKNPSKFKGGARPVETVAWIDCVEFCNILSKKK